MTRRRKYFISEDDARLIVGLKAERNRLKNLIARHKDDPSRNAELKQWRREAKQISDARIGEKFDLPMQVVRSQF